MAKKVTIILPAGIAVWPMLDQVDVYQPTDKKGRPSGAAKRRFITRVKYNDAITGHAPATAGRAYGKSIQEDLAEAVRKFPRYRLQLLGVFPADNSVPAGVRIHHCRCTQQHL